MHDFLKEQYQFTDYQIAVLKYFGKTVASELSKLLIMGFIFRDMLDVYAVAVVVMMLIRTSTGGLHCKRYISCLLASCTYMFLSLIILPMIPINKVFQMILLFICMLCNYYIGPVTSAVHAPLSEKNVKKFRIQAFLIIFFYITLMYIIPECPHLTAGFWVIILHTLQLIVARKIKKIKKGGKNYESKTYQA